MWKCESCGATVPRECSCGHGDATPPATPEPTGLRDGVWNPNSEGERPHVPGGVAKDHARAKQPVIAYACLYPKLATVAREHGYALAMHGSLVADCDLIAVPWVVEAAAHDVLAHALGAAAGGMVILDTWDTRPSGVRKHVIHLGGGPYLDLAVVPPAASGEQPFSATWDERLQQMVPDAASGDVERLRDLVQAWRAQVANSPEYSVMAQTLEACADDVEAVLAGDRPTPGGTKP